MGRRDTEARVLSEIRELVKIALRTDDEGQVAVTITQIERVIRGARAVGQTAVMTTKET